MGDTKMTPEEWTAELRQRDDLTRRVQERIDLLHKAGLAAAAQAQAERRESS
jgi:hypothetical protein